MYAHIHPNIYIYIYIHIYAHLYPNTHRCMRLRQDSVHKVFSFSHAHTLSLTHTLSLSHTHTHTSSPCFTSKPKVMRAHLLQLSLSSFYTHKLPPPPPSLPHTHLLSSLLYLISKPKFMTTFATFFLSHTLSLSVYLSLTHTHSFSPVNQKS